MGKKFFGFLLSLILLFSVLTMRANALSAIDLSRVKLSSGEEKLLFEFGDISIEGELRQE